MDQSEPHVSTHNSSTPSRRSQSASTSASPSDGRGASASPGAPKGRGRPKGPFTQHRRLDNLRTLLQKHPKGLTIYQLASELQVTPRSMRRYLAEVRRDLDLVST